MAIKLVAFGSFLPTTIFSTLVPPFATINKSFLRDFVYFFSIGTIFFHNISLRKKIMSSKTTIV